MDADLQERVQRIAARRSSLWVYGTIRWIIRTLLFWYFRVEHRGAEHLDTSGPLILAAVHRSNLDGPLIGGVSPRRFRALSKESLFSSKPAAAFMASIGAFPVKRSAADREAIRAATQILKAGEHMLIFPEGARQTGNEVTGVFDGVSYLASRTGATVVPVGIAGTEAAMASGTKLPRRSKVGIVAGAPINTPEGRMSRPEMRQFSETLREHLQAAFNEAQSLIASREH